MSKLYCPKGHEKMYHITGRHSMGVPHILQCKECNRPYFEIDCLTEPKTLEIEEKMSTESKSCEHDWGEWFCVETCFHDYEELCKTYRECKKCGIMENRVKND